MQNMPARPGTADAGDAAPEPPELFSDGLPAIWM
jgi:hypothetical protein